MTLRLQPATPFLGADVEGIDLPQLIAEGERGATLATLKRALDRHLALRFRAAHLPRPEIVRLGLLFGPLLGERKNENEPESAAIDDYPELKVISNAVGPDGRPVGDKGADAQIWHTDGSHRPNPNAFTLLAAETVPANPPRTLFLSSYTLYEALPADLKTEIAPLAAIHNPASRSQSFWEFMEGPSVDLERRAEGPRHPLVRLHPGTQRPYLYLPRRRDALVVGRTPEASRFLLERLWAEVFRATEIWAPALEPGDILISDNRTTMHRREGWDPAEPRVVFHLAIQGEVPVPAFNA